MASAERRVTVAEACWPGLAPLLQAMSASSDEEAGDMWDDIESWATRNGYPSPKAWAAMMDRAVETTGTRREP